jgi:hypothetical protein
MSVDKKHPPLELLFNPKFKFYYDLTVKGILNHFFEKIIKLEEEEMPMILI